VAAFFHKGVAFPAPKPVDSENGELVFVFFFNPLKAVVLESGIGKGQKRFRRFEAAHPAKGVQLIESVNNDFPVFLDEPQLGHEGIFFLLVEIVDSGGFVDKVHKESRASRQG
jgi:hypothetical protein